MWVCPGIGQGCANPTPPPPYPLPTHHIVNLGGDHVMETWGHELCGLYAHRMYMWAHGIGERKLEDCHEKFEYETQYDYVHEHKAITCVDCQHALGSGTMDVHVNPWNVAATTTGNILQCSQQDLKVQIFFGIFLQLT